MRGCSPTSPIRMMKDEGGSRQVRDSKNLWKKAAKAKQSSKGRLSHTGTTRYFRNAPENDGKRRQTNQKPRGWRHGRDRQAQRNTDDGVNFE